MEILYDTYDMGEEGVLYTTMLKQIIRDIIMIAAVIIPAIAHKKDFIKAKEESAMLVEKLVTASMESLFGKELMIEQEAMKQKMEGESLGYLLSPAMIRT